MKLTDAEWKIMNVLWVRHPASARDVLDELQEETGWAYTTIKTMLSRLEEKGALKSNLHRNTDLYAPLITRKQARRSAFQAMLENAFEGAFGPLLHFMINEKEMPEKARAELLEMLRKNKSRKESAHESSE